MLGIVFELFVVEEKLLAGGEYEFSAAIVALEDLILEFHGRLPQRRDRAESAMILDCSPVPSPCLVLCTKGPGRKSSGNNAQSAGETGDPETSRCAPCTNSETKSKTVTAALSCGSFYG